MLTITAPRPICPMCHELGVHASAQACIDALTAAVDQARRQLAQRSTDPAIAQLGRWVPSFYP